VWFGIILEEGLGVLEQLNPAAFSSSPFRCFWGLEGSENRGGERKVRWRLESGVEWTVEVECSRRDDGRPAWRAEHQHGYRGEEGYANRALEIILFRIEDNAVGFTNFQLISRAKQSTRPLKLILIKSVGCFQVFTDSYSMQYCSMQ